MQMLLHRSCSGVPGRTAGPLGRQRQSRCPRNHSPCWAMGDVSLTPVGGLPQQEQDFLVWTGWASSLPLAPCAGQAAPPLQRSSTCTGQGAGHGHAAVRSKGQT